MVQCAQNLGCTVSSESMCLVRCIMMNMPLDRSKLLHADDTLECES
jgi:hypothetical protein